MTDFINVLDPTGSGVIVSHRLSFIKTVVVTINTVVVYFKDNESFILRLSDYIENDQMKEIWIGFLQRLHNCKVISTEALTLGILNLPTYGVYEVRQGPNSDRYIIVKKCETVEDFSTCVFYRKFSWDCRSKSLCISDNFFRTKE